MSLSCDCNFDSSECEPGQSYYYYPNDFSKLNTKKRHRCVSCKSLIDVGSDVLEIERERVAYDLIEERIKGETYTISSHYICETCGEIFLNLHAIGYCLDVYSPMGIALKEYQELIGFAPVTESTN